MIIMLMQQMLTRDESFEVPVAVTKRVSKGSKKKIINRNKKKDEQASMLPSVSNSTTANIVTPS